MVANLERGERYPRRWPLARGLRAGVDGLSPSSCIPDADKIGKQFKYAAAARRAIRGGRSATRNVAHGTVDVKNLASWRAVFGAAKRAAQRRRVASASSLKLKARALILDPWLNSSVPSPAPTPAAPCAPPTSAPTSCCSAGCTACATSGRSLFLDVRDRARPHAGRSSRATTRCSSAPSGCAPSTSSPSSAGWSARSPETINANVPTGEVEVRAREVLTLLNEAKTPPFPISEDANVSEEMRLKYRYLDLRRPALQQQHRPAPPHHAGDAETTSTSRASGRSRRRS